jgi:hypothetical protein
MLTKWFINASQLMHELIEIKKLNTSIGEAFGALLAQSARRY